MLPALIKLFSLTLIASFVAALLPINEFFPIVTPPLIITPVDRWQLSSISLSCSIKVLLLIIQFFPKLSEQLHLTTFSEIAKKYLKEKGYEPYECKDEDEARNFFIHNSQFQAELNSVQERDNLGCSIQHLKQWPCYFTKSDTTGEKDVEEFFTENELLDMERFDNLGVIKNKAVFNEDLLNMFEKTIKKLKQSQHWTKKQIVELFFKMIPAFGYKDTGKYLDGKM